MLFRIRAKLKGVWQDLPDIEAPTRSAALTAARSHNRDRLGLHLTPGGWRPTLKLTATPKETP